MPDRVHGDEFRNTIVCIDSYKDSVMQGSFCNQFLQGPVEFHSTMEFLQNMEDMLEAMKLPQSFTVMRSFTRRLDEPTLSVPAMLPVSGKIATFSIRIIFRQNSSWQGSIRWVEGKAEQSFRSTLELLLLMDSGMSNKKSQGDT